MSGNNTDRSSSGSKSNGQKGPNTGSGQENRSQVGDKGARTSQKQQDQSTSKKNAPGSTPGGTHEQHVKAGEQSQKNR
jgi:hypothetical protein